MRALYIDPFSGISGNMFIGAMLDGGYKIEPFLKGLHPLGIHPHDVICLLYTSDAADDCCRV